MLYNFNFFFCLLFLFHFAFVLVAPWLVTFAMQACLDEVKKAKGSDSISLFVKTGDQKLVIGHLYAEKIPQIYFDLVFDKEFVLSHNGKNGSVHFHGYIANTGYPFR